MMGSEEAERVRIAAEVAALALDERRYMAWRAIHLPHIPEGEDPGRARAFGALAKWIEAGCPDE